MLQEGETGAREALLRGFFRDLLCCLGSASARHQLPEDAVWELVKGFDLVYLRARGRLVQGRDDPRGPRRARRPAPHPGILYLLEKLDREAGR